jgi:AcrR family transcriptional regulator
VAALTRRDEIVRAARELLERGGPDALTMRAVGERLGMRAPSLSTHGASKEELEAALTAVALEEMTRRGRWRARTSTGSRPTGCCGATSCRSELRPPRPRRSLQLVPDEHRPRALWAFAHGMTTLERAGRFPPAADLDAAWRAGLRAFAERRQPGRGLL